MKRTQLLTIFLFTFTMAQNSYASNTQSRVQSIIHSVLGNRAIEINDYDDQLKEVVVDSKVYFTTHDGRYLFDGSIIDTQNKVDIVMAKEDHLRNVYLSSLPQDEFVSYPSDSPSKYQVTVITDIDCTYCRKMHTYMPNFNKQGISVNYVMLPRAGVGSSSHKKTVSALCSSNPADSITSAMQNKPTAALSCKSNVVAKHMEIARNLKIRSTPTIILPSGRIKLGLTTPDQLITLLESGK